MFDFSSKILFIVKVLCKSTFKLTQYLLMNYIHIMMITNGLITFILELNHNGTLNNLWLCFVPESIKKKKYYEK